MTHALFTISFRRDRELSEALCRTIDQLMPQTPHYLVIDACDYTEFRHLRRPSRVILPSEIFFPGTKAIDALGRRWRLSLLAPPIRGWIFQQIIKLAAVAALEHDAVTIIDSDAVLVRPIEIDRVLREGRTRLYRVAGEGRTPLHVRWHEAAAGLLGLRRQGYFGADYISTAVTWRPAVARALVSRLEERSWLPWRSVLGWRWRFAEYILYGVFAEYVPGPHRDQVFFDAEDLCHCSWHYDLATPEGVAAFRNGLSPRHAAVLVQSNLSLPAETRSALLRGFEAASPLGG
jgi:hypothetical protein